MYKFWLVFNPARIMPKRQHSSRASAQQEAIRLAQQNPGESFVVLEGLMEYRTERPQVIGTHLEPAPEPENG